MNQKTVLASNNPGKLRELKQMLRDLPVDIVSQEDLGVFEAEETGLSFVENAILKARNAAKHTGLPAISDDSGLAVDALEGAPGIYSARYAAMGNFGKGDKDNNRFLLQEMLNVEDDKRSAQFVCVMAYVKHALDPIPVIAQGIWRGSILRELHGENGFGYDPLFWVKEHGCSSAELSKKRKNAISHRGIAINSLVSQLLEKREIQFSEKYMTQNRS